MRLSPGAVIGMRPFITMRAISPSAWRGRIPWPVRTMTATAAASMFWRILPLQALAVCMPAAVAVEDSGSGREAISSGMEIYGDITIAEGTVTVAGGTATVKGEGSYGGSDGIYVDGDMIITGGTVTATGGNVTAEGADSEAEATV